MWVSSIYELQRNEEASRNLQIRKLMNKTNKERPPFSGAFAIESELTRQIKHARKLDPDRRSERVQGALYAFLSARRLVRREFHL